MTKINKKLHWLNLHCKNDFIVSITENNKFNIRFNGKKIRENLSLHLLHRELDIFERKLSFGKDLDKIFNRIIKQRG